MKTAKEFIYEVIDNINKDDSNSIKIEKNPDFLLLHPESMVDSLLLVNLFVGIESLIEDQTGKSISIVNEESFDSDHLPFKSIGSLILYIQNLIDSK